MVQWMNTFKVSSLKSPVVVVVCVCVWGGGGGGGLGALSTTCHYPFTVLFLSGVRRTQKSKFSFFSEPKLPKVFVFYCQVRIDLRKLRLLSAILPL